MEVRRRGSDGHEVVFDEGLVSIAALVRLPNVECPIGTPRFYGLDLDLETWPAQRTVEKPVEVKVAREEAFRQPPGEWDWP